METPLLQQARQADGRFQNPVPTQVTKPGSLWASLKDRYLTTAELEPKQPPGPFWTNPAVYQQPAPGLRVTWIGHATVLLEQDGHRILTDPVWSAYAAPVQGFMLKRFFPATLPLHQLPALDAVLISHDHYDHLDQRAIRYLSKTPVQFVVPLGAGAYLRNWGVAADRITELDWTQSVQLPGGITITALPARHFSGRGLTDANRSLWASFSIRTDKCRVYFGGDSGWWEGFRAIGEQYGPFDLTILPIGAYDNYAPAIHLDPEQAGQAHRALGGQVLLPIHWGTFNMTAHAWREPAERILAYADTNPIRLLLPEPGKPTLVLPHDQVVRWWVPDDRNN